jgi:hypothetical protein
MRPDPFRIGNPGPDRRGNRPAASGVYPASARTHPDARTSLMSPAMLTIHAGFLAGLAAGLLVLLV